MENKQRLTKKNQDEKWTIENWFSCYLIKRKTKQVNKIKGESSDGFQNYIKGKSKKINKVNKS